MSDLIKMIYRIPGQQSQTRMLTPEKMADLFVDLSAAGATILVDVSKPKEQS